MAASNILDIPFRKGLPLNLSDAIKQYISFKYDQHPDMFKADLSAIDRLRAEAVNVLEAHTSGLQKLGRYAAQLEWIGGKFPIDIGANFTWYPSIGYNTAKPITQNNLQFERANVLFNLAALYSKLATSAPKGTPAGLKSACNYFSCAAGTIKYIKDTVLPELRSTPPEDMDPMTLECLEQLLLAQSQECFWQKAVIDGMKDSLIAKLAAKVADYYGLAGEFGLKSDAISSEWIHHMSAKHHHFAAAAQYRAACDCLERSKYGEEVARLADALDCVNDALKEARYLNKVVLADLKGLQTKISESYKRAEKDNNVIYMAAVPAHSELQRIQRADMVKPKLPKEIEDAKTISENNPLGAPLFAKLVPFAVHLAASIYAEKRDRLVNTTIIDELQSLTGKIHELLQSLNLPGSLQALEKPLGIPPGLIAHAEEIKQQDGVNKLIQTFNDIDTLKKNNHAMCQEALELLHSEASEDDAARTKYGTDRWNRQPSRVAAMKFIQKAEEYSNILKQAEQSDELVRNKFLEFEPTMRLLAGSKTALHSAVPSSQRTSITPKVEREVERLRSALNDVSRLESRRQRKIEELKEKAARDDITTDILSEAARLERERPGQKIEPVMFESFFDTRLQRYDTDRNLVRAEAEVQADLISRIREGNAAFVAARKGDSSTRDREMALQRLENAYSKYKEIIANLETGRRFYNDLTRLLARYRDEVKHFVYERRLEAGQVEADMVNAMSRVHISTPRSYQQPQTPQSYQQPQQTPQSYQQSPLPPQQQPSPTPQVQAQTRRTPLPGPVPTRTANLHPTPGLWEGDSSTPIRFGPPPSK